MTGQIKNEDIVTMQQAPFDQLAEEACMVEISVQQQQVSSGIRLTPVMDSERVVARLDTTYYMLDMRQLGLKIKAIKVAKRL